MEKNQIYSNALIPPSNAPEPPVQNKNYKKTLLAGVVIIVVAALGFSLYRNQTIHTYVANLKNNSATVDLNEHPEYKDGVHVLNKVIETYTNTKSYGFAGQANFYHLVGYEDSTKTTFSGQVARPDQLSTALELYFYDTGSYPQTLQGLLTPQSLTQLPSAPSPADGSCTNQQNQYTYIRLSESSYKVNFCLGAKLDVYDAGAHYLSQDGIK